MAMGSYSNNNQNNKGLYEPTYYPRLRWKNEQDGLVLSPSYWKGSLKLSISAKGNNPGELEEIGYIHLSPTKAFILAEYMQKIIDNPDGLDIYGVSTGTGENAGLIAIGRELGVPFLFVAKVDTNGNYLNSQKFRFNSNYHFGLNIHDLNKLSFEKEYVNNVELEQVRDMLIDWARSANGALAFSVHDVARYETAKMNNMLRKIAEKVGVEFNGGNKSSYTGGGSQNSFFNNNSGTMNKPASAGSRYVTSSDDLESELIGD